MENKNHSVFCAKHTRELGFKESLSGTPMLRHAVNYAAGFPETERLYMTKDIYPEVAEAFGCTMASVERNIRTAIRRAGYGGSVSDVIRDFAQRVRDGDFQD